MATKDKALKKVMVPQGLHHELKVEAAKRNSTILDLLVEFVQQGLRGNGKKREVKAGETN